MSAITREEIEKIMAEEEAWCGHDMTVASCARVAYLEQENARLTSEIIRVEGELAAVLSPNAGKEER